MINRQHITLDVQVTNLTYTWKSNFQRLPPNKIYELVIDYPLSNPAVYKIKTGKNGMGLVTLLGKIGKLYQRVYALEDRRISAGKEGLYGIWGHDMDDLAIEGININHKKKIITLDVGS
jgi:hypothetical protein